jgi:hypothetical protein
MSWKEVSTGNYTRELDNAKLLLKTVAAPFESLNREHWAINFVTTIRFDIQNTEEIITALRSAWVNLRYHHPHIATLLEAKSFTYQVPDENLLQDWLSESFFVHKDESVDEYLLSAPLMRYASLHYFPGDSELVMRIHHWLVDGTGAQHIVNRFFKLLADGHESPTFGEEWKRLPPSLREASDPSPEPSPERQEAAKKLFTQFASKMPSIGLPVKPRQDSPGGTLCSTREYPPTVLDTLLTACRKEGLSLTAALTAAIVVATQETPQESSLAKNYTTFACFDYRPYLGPPYNNVAAWPMGVYMLGLPASLPEGEFLLQAKELQKMYKQPLSRDKVNLHEYYDEYSGMMAAAMSQPLVPGMPLPTTPSLSSFGVMDRRLQARYHGKHQIEIERTALRTDVMMPTIARYQWSWKGKFMISACYNDGYYEKAFVEEFMGRVETILIRELGCDPISRG